MSRTNVALAVGLCLALTTVSASAGALSFESRGYGGPLYVGPNFQGGGQHSPPSYGPKSSSQERATTKRERSTAKSRKAPATREANTEKASPAAEAASIEKPESENSTISSASAPTNNAEKSSLAAKLSSIDKTAQSENSTITSASLQTDKTNAEPSPKAEASASPATCKRFIAAAGQTVTVPCD